MKIELLVERLYRRSTSAHLPIRKLSVHLSIKRKYEHTELSERPWRGGKHAMRASGLLTVVAVATQTAKIILIQYIKPLI